LLFRLCLRWPRPLLPLVSCENRIHEISRHIDYLSSRQIGYSGIIVEGDRERGDIKQFNIISGSIENCVKEHVSLDTLYSLSTPSYPYANDTSSPTLPYLLSVIRCGRSCCWEGKLVERRREMKIFEHEGTNSSIQKRLKARKVIQRGW